MVNVDRRMTYKEVAGILEEQDPALMEQYEPFVPMFAGWRNCPGCCRNTGKNGEPLILISRRRRFC